MRWETKACARNKTTENFEKWQKCAVASGAQYNLILFVGNVFRSRHNSNKMKRSPRNDRDEQELMMDRAGEMYGGNFILINCEIRNGNKREEEKCER